MIDRFRARRTRQPGSPLLTRRDTEWLAFLTMFALIVLDDRLTNLFTGLRPFNGLIYLIVLFVLACWAGLRPALACCALLVCYVWLAIHFYPMSAAVRNPRQITAASAALFVGLIYVPFALIGGFLNVLLRRATDRAMAAEADAERATERQRIAEEELWASEEMRNLIVESSGDAVVGISPDLTISFWSPNAERLFGWKRTEAIGSLVSDRIVPSSGGECGGSDPLALLSTSDRPILREHFETSVVTKDRDDIEVELYIVDHQVEGGTMFIVFARNVSERKRAEETIRELNAGLEQRVAERTQELEDANEELLGFTHTVSHDLRAPLRAIVSNSRIVCEESADVVPGPVMDRLKRLETNALKLAQLIDNLLQYARIGRLKPNSSDVNLSDMAKGIAEDLKMSREGSIDIQPGLVVHGDPQMVEMVLANLLDNAWKYVEPGQAPQVQVGKTKDGAIFVRDQGIGFDMKYVDRLWQPFERLHDDGRFPGTGIGLANTKRIINRHGGRIWTESAPGQGTTMYFYLSEPARQGEDAVPNVKRTRAKVR